jgi:2-keto-3-deoxy-L-fuconate dehydrogenase
LLRHGPPDDVEIAFGCFEESEAQARQAFIDRQPMGRLGTAEEIAMLAVYLASDEASYTTGQIHLADGGFAL